MSKRRMQKNHYYPSYICIDCGEKHCNWFPQKTIASSTFHQGVCDMCDKKTALTQPRDFGHLTQKAVKLYQKKYEESIRKKSGMA